VPSSDQRERFFFGAKLFLESFLYSETQTLKPIKEKELNITRSGSFHSRKVGVKDSRRSRKKKHPSLINSIEDPQTAALGNATDLRTNQWRFSSGIPSLAFHNSHAQAASSSLESIAFASS